MKLLTFSLLFSTLISLGQNKSYEINFISKFDSTSFINSCRDSDDFVIHNTNDSITNKVNFKMGWDSLNLFIDFTVLDSVWETSQTKHDSPIFKTDDCVEIFIDFDGDGKNYLELGINPNGVYYDYKIICPKPICSKWKSDSEFNLDSILIISYKMRNVSRIKKLQGLYKIGYNVRVSLPFKSLTPFKEFGFSFPKDGTKWKANLFNINPTTKAYNSWCPTKSFGFHQPDFFGELIFRK